MPAILEQELEAIRGRVQSLERENSLPAASRTPHVALYMAVDERLQVLKPDELVSLIEAGLQRVEILVAAAATEQRRDALKGVARLVLMELAETLGSNGSRNGSAE